MSKYEGLSTRRRALIVVGSAAGALGIAVGLGAVHAEGGVTCDPVIDAGCTPDPTTSEYPTLTKPEPTTTTSTTTTTTEITTTSSTLPETTTTTTAPETTTTTSTVPNETTTTVTPDAPTPTAPPESRPAETTS